MASRKRKAPSTPTQARFDRSRFTSQEAWERYTGVVVPCKLLPERNVVVYYTEFDEFKEELERCHWDEELTDFVDDNINVAITPVVMEEEETLCAYSRFALLRPDPQELVAKLCILGRGFELNSDGQPLKILRKNMTMLA
ncbi:hypothetical protein GmHk_08G023482 [Glycine max]|nr:hypothetical protein GmHk_08G023482 [Glycine max]